MEVLERLQGLLSNLTQEEFKKINELTAKEQSQPWLPTPSQQLEAYLSNADILLYGGAAGGGKTDLICGLALNEHERTVVFRSKYKDLNGFWDRLCALTPNYKHINSSTKRLVTLDGRLIECGHLELPNSERSWQGVPHDLIAFDEGAQLSESKVHFVMGWNRSSTGKRCRIVIASNPPMGGDGAWLLKWFAPWVDPLYPNPANSGELRWAIILGSAGNVEIKWVKDSSIIELEGKTYTPKSFTFIPANLNDNPHLRDTGYRATLQAMPEPMRSQLLNGDFLAAGEDDEWQVIPSKWIKEAQGRVNTSQSKMVSIGVDIAQGGADKTSLVALYQNNVFDDVKSIAGCETPDGASVASLVLKMRRDNASVALDATGGWGGSTKDHLKTHHGIDATPIVFSSSAGGLDPDINMGYLNLRAKMYWQFRKALDPESSEQITLPKGARILAQLSASRWSSKNGKIAIESKEDIRRRLGSSPDDADAIVMAWHIRQRSLRQTLNNQQRPVNTGYVGSGGWML